MTADFPAADRAQWRALVDKVLKGADFERRLVRTTYDGIPVRPLYDIDETAPLRAAAGLPGSAPFLRGATAAGTVAGGWDVRQRHAHPDPAIANAEILEDLERGVTSIQLRFDRALAAGGTTPDGIVAYDLAALERTLEGVYLDLAPVGLDAGARFAEAAELLLALVERRGLDPAAVRADLDADPLGALAQGEALDPAAAHDRALVLARTVAARWPQVGAFLADGRPYHAGGATEAQELACAVASGIFYLRALVEAGIPAAEAARQIGMALAVDADFFLGVAKLRALRRLWARVLEVAGTPEAMRRLRLRAETATRMFSRRDPYVNMLRSTVATFAAAAGGATSITVLPFDHALGFLPDAFARRIARNTQLVLREESNLGRVIDPAGGASYVEALTDQLAKKAWALVQEIERRGGMLAALRAGWLQALVAESWAERLRQLATRREPVTGVSEFPDLYEEPRRGAPLPDLSALVADVRARLGNPTPTPSSGIAAIPAHRLAEPFEALRDRSDAILARTGARPRVFLCNLGRLAEFTARATFAKNLFEAGGLETVASEPIASLEEIGHAFKASGARLAAICSSDENYAAMAEGAARALEHAHAARIYLMGRPEEERRAAYEAAGIDEFVYVGSNVLEMLERAYETLAGEAAA
ncbi:methylmalonyl-CoA mutase family protein [Benzoatithermus flavus]|uniref:Methylmalonyl-CoA mutase family protein n=1 Tax=Benzoatithermus flavus TaxID=3108223 RepID=A0ABU8XPD9_9PROT